LFYFGGFFYVSDDDSDKDKKSGFALNGFTELDDDDVIRWNLEDVEAKKEKLESGIFGVSVVDKKWNYRGEGGANLVISLADEKQVIPLKHHADHIGILFR
jgi:hypothetical protein